MRGSLHFFDEGPCDTLLEVAGPKPHVYIETGGESGMKRNGAQGRSRFRQPFAHAILLAHPAPEHVRLSLVNCNAKSQQREGFRAKQRAKQCTCIDAEMGMKTFFPQRVGQWSRLAIRQSVEHPGCQDLHAVLLHFTARADPVLSSAHREVVHRFHGVVSFQFQ